MTPKRCGPYLGPGPKRGRRRVAQDIDGPSPEVEQPEPEPQEEVNEMPQWFESPIPRAQRSGMSQRRATTQDLPDADSTAPSPEAVPPMPTNNIEIPPSQPTTNLTADGLQAFTLTSMENQTQMTQMMQTLVTNQATMQQAIQQATMQQTIQQATMQQTTMQGIRDSRTMAVESRYLKDFQGHNLPSFDSVVK